MTRWIVTLHEIDHIKKLKDAGATEILLAVPFFSLRGARLFPVEEVPQMIAAIHDAGLAAAVNCTRLFMEDELPDLRRFLTILKDANADTIYFADEGVLMEAMQIGIADRLVYQPDTLMTNSMDASFYLAQGCKAVSMAREITLEEIERIAEKRSEIEVLIHGRFSIMHSRRMLLTNYFSFLGKKHDIRGKRNLALREVTRVALMPIVEDEAGTHVFSEYTQQSFAQIADLSSAGVERFRIDSIFHDDDWSVQALKDYHAVLKHPEKAQAVIEKWKKDTDSNYSEGFYYTKTTLVKE